MTDEATGLALATSAPSRRCPGLIALVAVLTFALAALGLEGGLGGYVAGVLAFA